MEQNGSSPIEQAHSYTPAPVSTGPLYSGASLDGILPAGPAAGHMAPVEEPWLAPRRQIRWWKWAALGVGICLLGGGTIMAVTHQGAAGLQAGRFDVVTTPLSGFEQLSPATQAAHTLDVNGALRVDGSIVLAPGASPSDPQTGQLFYDKTGNHFSYYDGQEFQTLGNGNTTTNITNVLGGVGNGVQLQSTTPGTQQTGNFNISGTGVIGAVQTKVIDSKGSTLYINPVGATAQQQIAVGTPATVGLNTAGSVTSGAGWSNTISATKVTMGAVGGTTKSIAVYFASVSAGDHVQVALYDDDGDIPSKPGNLLAASASVPLTTNGFTTVTIPTVNLTANASYWLAVNTDSATAVRTFNGGNKDSCFISSGYGFMPDPFSAFGCFYDNNVYAIYLNYLMGAGTSGTLSAADIAVGATGQILFQNAADSTTALQVQNAAGTSTVLNVDTINGRVAIGKATASYKLDIAAGDVNLSNGRSLRFGGLQVLSTNGTGATTSITNFVPGGQISAQADSFVVQDANASHQKLSIDSGGAVIFSNSSNSTTAFQIQNAANTTTVFSVDTTNSVVTVTSLVSTGNLTVGGHLITGGSAPGIAAGVAACTTPTVSVSGNDTSGVITVTTGSGCASSGALATVAFAAAFATAPHVIITAGSSASLGLGVYVDDASVSTASFVIGTNTTPASTTTYKWNYLVVE